MAAKKITVSVISDLTTDQRVIRICSSLVEMGFEVEVIARAFNNSLPLDMYPFKAQRIRCRFRQGFLQYAEFNFKLFWKLIFIKTDYLLANDLDSLLPNYIVSKWRSKKIFYDTHEYFTGVPELKKSAFKRKVWKTIEDWIFPKLPVVYTVNDSVKKEYEKEYGNTLGVIRNMPRRTTTDPLPLPEAWVGKKILLMQGAGINTGRGGLELLSAMPLLSAGYLLVYIGGGTEWELIAQKTKEWNLQEQVIMMEKMPPSMLKRYTPLAHLGFSLDSFDDVNYLFNLPNKVFDYMHAGVPLIATSIPEVKKIMDEYHCGLVINDLQPATIAGAIEQVLADEKTYHNFKLNCKRAAEELCWENESIKLKAIYQPYL